MSLGGVDETNKQIPGISVFDATQSKWYPEIIIPGGVQPSQYSKSVAIGVKVLTFGGCDEGNSRLLVVGSLFELPSSTWQETHPALIAGRKNFSFIQAGDKAILWGGSADGLAPGLQNNGAIYSYPTTGAPAGSWTNLDAP